MPPSSFDTGSEAAKDKLMLGYVLMDLTVPANRCSWLTLTR